MPQAPPPHDSEDLIADLLKQAEREKLRVRLCRWITVALSVNYFVFFLARDYLPKSISYVYLITSLLLFWFGGSSLFRLFSRPTRGLRHALTELLESGSPNLASALTETFLILSSQGVNAADLRKVISQALAESLDDLTCMDGERWTATQRAALRDVLRTSTTASALSRDVRSITTANWNRRWLFGQNVDLALSILRAIARIGNKDDMDAVAAIAGSETTDEKSEEVRVAAERCLAVLEARVEEQRKSETLVRPSESAESVLLRSATPSSSLDEEQTLLRPGEQG